MTVLLGYQTRELEPIQATITENISFVTDAQGVHNSLESNLEENLLLIAPSVPMEVVASLTHRYRLVRPTLGVILIRRDVDSGILHEAISAGVRNVVAMDDANALLSAYSQSKKLSREISALATPTGDSAAGKVILVFGAKGGCGKTTIATNLALAISDGGNRKVAIVDFDLEFGDVAINLNLFPKYTLATAAQMRGSLDAHAVASIVTHHHTGLDAILAPTKPAEAELITPELAMDLLLTLKQSYDYIIIDAAPSFTEISLRCFELADSYQLVTTLDIPSVKNLKIALDTMDTLGYPRSKWNLILNRSNSRVGLTIADVEAILRMKVQSLIPSSGDVPAALNAGKTIWESQPKHEVSVAIKDCARKITGENMGEKKRSKFFKRRSAK